MTLKDSSAFGAGSLEHTVYESVYDYFCVYCISTPIITRTWILFLAGHLNICHQIISYALGVK